MAPSFKILMSRLSNTGYESAEGPFLRALFNRFSIERVWYAVLRNHASLPASTGGSDIDILFYSEHFSKAHSILQEVATSFGGRCISGYRGCRVKTCCFCGRFQGRWWGVRFDTFSYVGTNGYDILPAKFLLERSVEVRCVRVAEGFDSDIVSYLKDIIGAGQDRKNYRDKAQVAFSNNRIRYCLALSEYFGQRGVERTLSPILENRNIDIAQAKKQLRRQWTCEMVRKRPMEVTARRFRDVTFRLSRFRTRPGACVGFLGPDGSGKTTLIEGIAGLFGSAFHKDVKVLHMRPNLLPSLARVFGRGDPKGPVTNPHGSRPSGFAGSLARLLYYYLDYFVGYWIKVYPAMIKGPGLHIFDRYYYDLLFDAKRSRVSLPPWLIRLVSLGVPRPDIIICLGCDAAIMHSRKPELPVSEIDRQLRILKDFSKSNSSAFWVDTGGAIEKSIDTVASCIVTALGKRHE